MYEFSPPADGAPAVVVESGGRATCCSTQGVDVTLRGRLPFPRGGAFRWRVTIAHTRAYAITAGVCTVHAPARQPFSSPHAWCVSLSDSGRAVHRGLARLCMRGQSTHLDFLLDTTEYVLYVTRSDMPEYVLAFEDVQSACEGRGLYAMVTLRDQGDAVQLEDLPEFPEFL